MKSIMTMDFDVLDIFIGQETKDRNKGLEIIKVKAFIIILLALFIACTFYITLNIFKEYYELMPVHILGLAFVVCCLLLLKSNVSNRIVFNLFIGMVCSVALLICYKSNQYIRILPWWGVFMITIPILSERTLEIAIWSGILYGCAIISLSFGPSELFYNKYLTLTLVFFFSFIIQSFYFKRKTFLINQLDKALKEIKTLKGLLPICANCKKIRDEEGLWNKIESYISKHSNAEFTHSYCPDCIRELYPDMADEILMELGEKEES